MVENHKARADDLALTQTSQMAPSPGLVAESFKQVGNKHVLHKWDESHLSPYVYLHHIFTHIYRTIIHIHIHTLFRHSCFVLHGAHICIRYTYSMSIIEYIHMY